MNRQLCRQAEGARGRSNWAGASLGGSSCLNSGVWRCSKVSDSLWRFTMPLCSRLSRRQLHCLSPLLCCMCRACSRGLFVQYVRCWRKGGRSYILHSLAAKSGKPKNIHRSQSFKLSSQGQRRSWLSRPTPRSARLSPRYPLVGRWPFTFHSQQNALF